MGLEGENRLRGDPKRNEIAVLFGSLVFVLGGSLFGGEMGQSPSAPILPRRRQARMREDGSPNWARRFAARVLLAGGYARLEDLSRATAQRGSRPGCCGERPEIGRLFALAQFVEVDAFVDFGDGDFDADFGHAKDVVISENGGLPDLVWRGALQDRQPDAG